MFTVGTYIFCMLTLPLQTTSGIVYERIEASCEVKKVDSTITGLLLYVDCSEDRNIKFLKVHPSFNYSMRFWERIGKGECYE